MKRQLFAMNVSAIALLVCNLTGCSSVNSTLVDWDPWEHSWASHKSDGYPITLRVPTHMRVDILESQFMNANGNIETYTKNKKTQPAVKRRNVRTEIVYTSEIFTVDMKRPAAGKMNYGVNFTEDQYFQQIQSREADDTIQQSSAAVVRIIDALRGAQPQTDTQLGISPLALTGTAVTASTPGDPPTGSQIPTTTPDEVLDPIVKLGGKDVNELESVIASETFDLNDPALEQNIASFVGYWLSVTR